MLVTNVQEDFGSGSRRSIDPVQFLDEAGHSGTNLKGEPVKILDFNELYPFLFPPFSGRFFPTLTVGKVSPYVIVTRCS